MTGVGAAGVVDLRSDTVTKPTEAMRAAMAAAEVGDDVFSEDPTVARLEAEVAELLGHEAGVFTPTGSMANWLAVNELAPVGSELLCDSASHIVRAELGAHGALGSATTRTWPTRAVGRPAGEVDPGVVVGMLAAGGNPYMVGTAAVAVENTHNFAGGTVQPLAVVRELSEALGARGVAMHIDGARLWNACAATGVSPAAFGECASTVSVCLSKGLGAPVGSVLVGPVDVVASARVWRKRCGGGMRQVGVLAAAGLHALHHHRGDLVRDHEGAQVIASACHAAVPSSVDPEDVHTNIVLLSVRDASAVVQAAQARGVLLLALDATTVRVITHRDVTDGETQNAAAVLADLITHDAT